MIANQHNFEHVVAIGGRSSFGVSRREEMVLLGVLLLASSRCLRRFGRDDTESPWCRQLLIHHNLPPFYNYY